MIHVHNLVKSFVVITCFFETKAVKGQTIACGRTTEMAAIPKIKSKPKGAAFWTPNAPEYPYFGGFSREKLIAGANCLSSNLENYIKAWMDGKADATLPPEILPKGYDDNIFQEFRLMKPDEVRPDQQWVVRPAEVINVNAARGAFPDPNATYLVAAMFAPFGTKVIIEGNFPHSRFFDIQASPSFWPENYRYNQRFGVPEVPLTDVDIIPSRGSFNPFLVGSNRNSKKRAYRVELDLRNGDPILLNKEAFTPPYYRAKGNTRYASGIQYQGPWGAMKGGGHGRGIWDFGQIWIRYYAPDQTSDSLAGVILPKVYYQLPDGRKYYILIDQSRLAKTANKKVKVRPTNGSAPILRYGPHLGWTKEFGIFRAISSGIAINTNFTSEEGKKYVREVDKGVTGRGQDLLGASHYEPSATSATYINYLLRGMSCEKGKVVVLTGKLPTTPKTRKGDSIMQKGQARYWSIVGYSVPTVGELIEIALNPNAITGIAVQALYDEEIMTNRTQDYIIVLSRPEDKPSNAISDNGVTWSSWGPRGEVSWTIRWLSVHPEWSFEKTPSETFLPWNTTEWASDRYDKTIIGENQKSGILGEYLPIVHYLSKSAFEALGSTLESTQIPLWNP